MSKAIALFVAACLVAGLVLNILVATSCDFVQLTVPGSPAAMIVRVGVFQYSVDEKDQDAGATSSPTSLTASPTSSPAPSSIPSGAPSFAPTVPGATARPTNVPSFFPTATPSHRPSTTPTVAPTTEIPSVSPTTSPSGAPTDATITQSPTTLSPTFVPSTLTPTFPNVVSTPEPTAIPTTDVTTMAPTFLDVNTTTLSPTLLFADNFRSLQEETTNNLAFTDGSCTDFGDNTWDNDSPMAAQIGVYLAPIAGGIVLLLVGILTFHPTLPLGMPLMWTGYGLAQIGTALLWTVLQTDQVCESPVKDECEWQLSTAAWMTIGVHIAYAVAAFASCKLLPTTSTSQPPNDSAAQEDNPSVRSDDFTPTIVNTAMLEDPTVYDNDEKRVRSLQAELDAQRQAAAMEAGRARAVAEELQDHEAELAATKEQLWEAQQEAEAHRDQLAAAAALATATTTVDALRADELEEQLQEQSHKLEDTMAAMDQLGTQIHEKELLLAAATAKSAAAAAESARIHAMQAELDKLRETGLGYYPEVWKWLGFKEPKEQGIDTPKTPNAETKVPEEPQHGYYPAVWKWLGFIEPRAYVPRMPDPEGNTAKELLLKQEQKAKEDELVAIAAATTAAMETQKLRDELDQHRKDIQEIKAATRMSIRAQQDPPMVDPRDSNRSAAEPEGLRDSQLATPVKAVGDDPPEETFTDPANDPDGVRSSAVKKGNAKTRQNIADPPMNTYSDPTNDPGGRRSSQTPRREVPPAHDPPLERFADPANDPEEARRSTAGQAPSRSVDPIDHVMQDPSPGNGSEEAEQPVSATEEATADSTEGRPPRNHDIRKSQ